MAYVVTFGDNKLSDYCTILNVKRSVLPNRSNFSKQIPTMNGSYFTGSKYSERIITLEAAIFATKKEEYALKVGKLAEILDVKSPTQLIIDDEPYKMYYAVLDGSTDLSKFAQTGRVNLTFLCNDPLAYSMYWNTYEPSTSGIFTVESYGTADTYPLIDVDFRNKGCFFQLTNPQGQTVLIGQPKDSTKPSKPVTDVLVNDNCESSGTVSALSESLLDSNRLVTGQYGVGHNGTGLVCTNFGTGQEGKWTGAAFRRNIGQNVGEFEVTVDLVFSSQGKNYVAPKPEPPVPQPKPPTPPSKPPTNTTKPPAQSLGTYKVVNCGGLYINRDANPNSPLYPMAPGTLIYPTEIKNGWAKHTHSNPWNTFTGWSSMKYLQKVSNSGKSLAKADVREIYAEDQLGLIEIYGFDQNGAKLFKLEMSDTSEFYEYVDPKLYIGNSLVLHDGKNTPSPRKTSVTENGKTTQTEMASGVFGDYNDFNGQLIIRKEKSSTGKELWSCEVRKLVNGKFVRGMATSNSLTNSAYPKGDLNYIGVFIGQHGTKPPTSVMAVTNIKVRKLNMKTDQTTTDNLQIFENGDHMQIDFASGLVTLNDEPILSKIDIGSEFFTIPSGRSQFIFKTDAANTSAVCGFQDRFI